MQAASHQDDQNGDVTLESTVLRSLDPQILYSFFKKEADALDAVLSTQSIPSQLQSIRQNMIEQLADAPRGINLLYSRVDDYQRRNERLQATLPLVPELRSLLVNANTLLVEHEWNTQNADFTRLYTAFFNRIQVYGMSATQDGDASAANALNTRYSTFTDADRDYLVAETFGSRAHLLFWDVSFCLKMQVLEHNLSQDIAKLTSDYRERVNDADLKEPTSLKLRRAYSELQQITADLPADNIPIHMLEAFTRTVENYIHERVARVR